MMAQPAGHWRHPTERPAFIAARWTWIMPKPGAPLSLVRLIDHLPAPTEPPRRLSGFADARQAMMLNKRPPAAKDWLDWTAGILAMAKAGADKATLCDALRLQAIAMRRVGRVLRQYGAGPFGATDAEQASARRLGATLGLSERTIDLALRIARLSTQDFDRLIAAEEPLSLTALAELGDRAEGHASAPQRAPKQDMGADDQAAHNAGQALLSLAHLSQCTDPPTLARAIEKAEKPTRALYQSALAFARETLGHLGESPLERPKSVAR